MHKITLNLIIAIFVLSLFSAFGMAHGMHDFNANYMPYKEKMSGHNSIKKEYTSPDGREKVIVSERTSYSESRPYGKINEVKTTTVKRTYDSYPIYSENYYNYDMNGYPSSHWKYKDYKENYYEPRFNYQTGSYDWRFYG